MRKLTSHFPIFFSLFFVLALPSYSFGETREECLENCAEDKAADESICVQTRDNDADANQQTYQHALDFNANLYYIEVASITAAVALCIATTLFVGGLICTAAYAIALAAASAALAASNIAALNAKQIEDDRIDVEYTFCIAGALADYNRCTERCPPEGGA